ncbi:MAG: PEP-CTERM sorting domain-containing protein [Deltaproteobacteria bacterium]|nr:PEP-CTERM sorting domain-containing protein [Deltaproteobacteria bacterium]
MLRKPATLAPAILAIFIVAVTFILAVPCQATPVFYLSPGNNPGADLNGDLPFQQSVAGYTFIEEDFDEYPSYGYPGPTLSYGAIDVTLSMELPNHPPRTWQGWWNAGAGQAGGLYGAIYGRALPSYGAHHYTFSFSGTEKVVGFGIWVFDDNTGCADDFTLTVTGLDGSSWTSGVLDANPDKTNHAIDGFIGVALYDGISQVTINNLQSGVFHLDHMQVAATPEPGTLALLLIGVLGLAGIRKKSKP